MALAHHSFVCARMSKRRAHNHDHNKPSKRARIDAGSGEERNAEGLRRSQNLHERECERQAENGTCAGKQKAFGEHLANQS